MCSLWLQVAVQARESFVFIFFCKDSWWCSTLVWLLDEHTHTGEQSNRRTKFRPRVLFLIVITSTARCAVPTMISVLSRFTSLSNQLQTVEHFTNQKNKKNKINKFYRAMFLILGLLSHCSKRESWLTVFINLHNINSNS